MALKEVYTTRELSAFCGVAVKNLLQRAARENWQYRKRSGRGGGNEWLVASMPDATRREIEIAEERLALASQPAQVPAPLTSTSMSAAILDDKRRYKALAKADLVGLYCEWQDRHGYTVKEKDGFIHAYLGGAWPQLKAELGDKVSWKSLERWKLQQTKGNVLMLADKRGLAHRGRTMLTERHTAIILGQVLDGEKTLSYCLTRIRARCKAEGLVEPSDATLRRWVAQYAATCYSDWTLFRRGEKAWNDNCAISILRDWSLIEVGDVVIADGHTLNFETVDPETGKAKRMTLLLFFDGASRYPLGWEIMSTENVGCISSAFRRACISLGKFPKVVYLDNGRAFRARFFEGCPDFEQAGFLGLYRELGCQIIHAWPYHGQSKPVERFFGTMHEAEELAPSYTGWDIAHKPARLHRNEKLHRKLHEKLGRRPLTLEETFYFLASWFETYVSRPQPRTHLGGRTPREVYTEGRGPGVDVSKLNLLMLQREVRSISKDGIRLRGRLYYSEALFNRRHPVLVRYDWQLSPYTVLVYDTNGEFICEARDRAHYQIAAGVHPAARVLGTASQQRDLSDALALKKEQERSAKSGIRQMTEAIILPEARERQIMPPAPVSAPQSAMPAQSRALQATEAEKAACEAAKATGAAEREREDERGYTPSVMLRFADAPARYAYLFAALHEQGATLVPEDAAFMQHFEESDQYANFAALYEARLELLAFKQKTTA